MQLQPSDRVGKAGVDHIPDIADIAQFPRVQLNKQPVGTGGGPGVG